jgi:hypothetical protein
MSVSGVSPSLLTVLPVLVATVACSPALDWRDVRLDGPDLLTLFPCRPVAQAREVDLAGATRTMRLHACEAAGRTYAVMVVDVEEPAGVGPALVALREASLAKALDGQSPSFTGWSAPAGATPQPAAGRWQLPVTDGVATKLLDMATFSRGTWVVQASVIGVADPARSPVSAVDSFWEGLRFAP